MSSRSHRHVGSTGISCSKTGSGNLGATGDNRHGGDGTNDPAAQHVLVIAS